MPAGAVGGGVPQLVSCDVAKQNKEATIKAHVCCVIVILLYIYKVNLAGVLIRGMG